MQRLTYFTSSTDFNLQAAHEAKMEAKQPENIHNFERFSNDDYDNFKHSDLRCVRYSRSSVYEDHSHEDETVYFQTKRFKR